MEKTLVPLVGAQIAVPLVSGEYVPYCNLDYAASAPALRSVADAVDACAQVYSSVHRGAGYKSQVATAAFEGAREAVAAFVGARHDDVVIFTRNTTDALNLLASSVPSGTTVVSFEIEHHANLLPWRRHGAVHLPAPPSPAAALDALAAALRGERGRRTLVAVTGASNVTGELWPLADIVALAHEHGARVVVDAAQLAPHVPVDLAALGADWLALSGHKLYAPYGAGALVGRPDWLAEADPFLAGGGAVDFVTVDDVAWTRLPDRQEAGSPNVLGAVALGVACDTLARLGMATIAADEDVLARAARERLAAVPGVSLYGLWPDEHPRIGVLTFNLEGYRHELLATVLSAEYGIGVRHGCFCAHPLMIRLLGVGADDAAAMRARIAAGLKAGVPGAVRASLGLDSTPADVERLASALERIAADGPRWRYVLDERTGEYAPDPDPRPWPEVPFRLAPARAATGESS